MERNPLQTLHHPKPLHTSIRSTPKMHTSPHRPKPRTTPHHNTAKNHASKLVRGVASTSASQNVGKTDKTSCSDVNVDVGNPYIYRSGRRSRQYDVKVQFRVGRGVYEVLRSVTPNVSEFLRGLVVDFLERLPRVSQVEEFRLEVEVAKLTGELERVHRWQKAVLKHGSYAEAYLQQLRGGVILDRKPFHLAKPPAEIKPEELQTVQSIVEYREILTRQLVEKLNRLVELKKANLNLKGGENPL